MSATQVYLIIAALFGFCGVAMLAGGAHASGGSMTIAGQMLLFHAPVLMAGALARKLGFMHGRAAQVALVLMVLGVAVFSGDLALRAAQGVKLFAMAAPMGGIFTMAGWLVLAASVFLNRNSITKDL